MDMILFLFLGVLLGFVVGFLWQKYAAKSTQGQQDELMNDLKSQLAVQDNQIKTKSDELDAFKIKAQSDNETILQLNSQTARLETELASWKTKLAEHQQEFEKNQKQLETQFENLANKIFESKSQKFVETNKTSIDIILNPLKEKISEFEKKVETSYNNESKERHTLQSEIKTLVELNTKLNDEAARLTRALKGDSKKQGNWGEIILGKVLESSGLREGEEFVTQFTTSGEDNNRLYPDVIVNLPDNKHLVIDSKVSLVAYERLVNAETSEERASAINEHIISVKNHVRMLSDKDYFKAKDIKSPDFVLMFMPIESSFGAAIEADSDLFAYAWDRKIVIVSPSTLLATLKTVHSIWRQEKQNINAANIASEAGNLYDKFEGFVADLQKLGSQLDTVNKTYSGTFNKLKDGKGNILSRVQKLKTLGAKTSKVIDKNLMNEALANDGELFESEIDENEV